MRLCYSPAFACLLFLQSCVFSSQPAPPPEPQLGPVASFLRDAAPGEAKQLDDPAFGGPVDVRFEEEIDPHAFDECDKRNLFFKVNHEDSIVPCARYKEGRTGPGTMSLSLREDGLYFQANLANTQTSRDTYELVRSEVLTEMSFAFTISASETTQTEEKRAGQCSLITLHRKVTKIDHLYDVSAVCNPAYANTSLYARSRADAEALVREAVEAARQQRMAKLREIGAKALRGEPTD